MPRGGPSPRGDDVLSLLGWGKAGAAQLWAWLVWGRAHLPLTLTPSSLFHPRPGNWVRPRFAGPRDSPGGGPDGGRVGQVVQTGTREGQTPSQHHQLPVH